MNSKLIINVIFTNSWAGQATTSGPDRNGRLRDVLGEPVGRWGCVSDDFGSAGVVAV